MERRESNQAQEIEHGKGDERSERKMVGKEERIKVGERKE